jgi:hypothetical protein
MYLSNRTYPINQNKIKEGIQMPIGSITINDYQVLLGGSRANHNELKTKITDIIRRTLTSADVRRIDFFNLNGQPHEHKAGIRNERIVIFTNAVAKGSPEDTVFDEPITINGIENSYTRYHSPLGDGTLILGDQGLIIAEWRESTWELNILFDVFNVTNPAEAVNVFEFIMKEFERLVLYPKTFENSWKHTQNKSALTSRFLDKMKKQRETLIKSDMDAVTNYERKIDELKRSIKSYTDTLYQKRRQVAAEQQNIANIGDTLLKDLNLIIAHEKISDLQIKDGKFTVFTNPLNIYADTGKVYYGGKYKIELEPENADVRFFGDNPRQGYWTDRDPHPHVDGKNGEACLGNVSSTIAELCSQMQIYALSLVCIDFLESANTSDAAGRNVTHWDEVDEDGNIVAEGGDFVICP